MKIQTIIQIVLVSILFLNVESKKINCLHLQQDECIKNKDKCFLSNVNSCCEKDFLMCLPISSKYCESSADDVFSNKNILKKSPPPSNSHEWCLKKKKSILRFNTSCVPELDLDSEYFKPNLYKCKYSKCQKGFKCVDEKLHKKCETENNPCCKYESKCVPSKDIDQNEAPIFKNPKGQLAHDIYNHLNPDSPQLKDKPTHDNHKKDKNNKKHKNKKDNNNKNNSNNNKKNKTINNNNEPNQNQQSNPIDRTFNNETPIPWNFKNQDQQQQKQRQEQKQGQEEYFKPGSPYPVLPNVKNEPTTHLYTIEPTTFTASASRYQLEGNDNNDLENIDENNDEDKKKKKKKKDDKSKKPKDDEKHSKKPNVTEQPADDPSIEITEEPTIPPSSSPVHEDPCKKATCPIGSHCLVYGNQAYCKLDKPPNYQTMNPLPQKQPQPQQPQLRSSVKKMDSLSMFYKKSKMLLSEYTTEQRPELTCSTIKCEDDEVCINKVGSDPYCQIKPPPKPVSYNKTSCSQCPIGSYRCNPNPNGSGVICETDAINCRLIACKEDEFCIDNIQNTPPKCYPKLICNRSKIPPDYYCISDEIRGGFYVKYESYIDLSCETLLCEGVNSYCVENGGPICKTWPNDTIQYQPSCDKCPKDTMSCTPNENGNNKGVVCRIDRPSCSVIQCPENQYCVNTDKGPKCYKRSIECNNSRCPRDYTCKRDEIRGGACLKKN
ncbi:hypothetical protein ACTFIW_008148 [Dictyostelium discoideum]